MTMSTRQLLVFLVFVLGGLSVVVGRHLQDVALAYDRFQIPDLQNYEDEEDLEMDPYRSQIYLEKVLSRRYIDNELPYFYEQIQQRGRRQAKKTKLRAGPSLCHFKICNMGKKKKTRA